MRRRNLGFIILGLLLLALQSGGQRAPAPSAPQRLSTGSQSASSEIRKESNGSWLYINGSKMPALTGMVYQPVPKGEHIKDYANRWGVLYKALLDESLGGQGHARRLAGLGIKAIRIYEVPIHNSSDAAQVKEIFRWMYRQHQIKVLVGYWAGLFSKADFKDPLTRGSIILDAIQMTEMYCGEPWLLGWQVGNENNYHVLGGALRQEINLELRDYFPFMDLIAGAIRETLGRRKYHQIVVLGQGDLTPADAASIAAMRNIDAIGINAYRAPQGSKGIEEIIRLAAEKISKPIIFSEFGRPAPDVSEQAQQGEYLQQVSAVLFAHAAGRLGFGNVIAGFVHEATDEAWKQYERGKSEDAHYGVFGKTSELALKNSITAREEFYKILPLTNAPEDLMRAAWQLLDQNDYGYAMGYALKINELYGKAAANQQALLKGGDAQVNIDKNWALNAVGSAHFLLGKAYYQMDDKARSKDAFNILTTQYQDAYLRDRDGHYWQLSWVVRKLFPDLFEPYFQVDLKNTVLFTGFFLLLIILQKRRSKATRASRIVEDEPVMSIRNKVEFILLITLQTSLMFYFSGWWFHPVRLEFHIVSPLLFWILSAVGIFDCAFFIYIWHLLWSMKRPKKLAAEYRKKIAMVTTSVAGEPLDMLERTLVAMRNVRYPHDTFVLDEADDPQLKRLCRRLKVFHFTRKGTDRYNRSSGRFQSRTKGGNLNAWLDAHGHHYEFVTFLDPDHAPRPNYLDEVIGYFRDSRVGFVQAPQIYGNQADHWIARGAAEQTFYYYGPILMGLYGRDNCIANGSHSTFRTKALSEIGGYAVHDADDVLTSLRLAARQWRGVYVPKVLAVGLAPLTWPAFLAQQFRWAHSMLDLFLHYYRREFRGLNWSQRLGYLVIGSYYFSAIFFVLLLLLPVISIFMNQAPANTELLSFCSYFLPFLSARYVLLILWSKKFLIQPEKESGLWFRGGLLWIATWPYYFWAFLKSIPKNRVRPRITTPKDGKTGQSALVMFRPHLVLIGLTAIALAYTFVFHSYIWPSQGMRTFLIMSLVCQLSLALTSMMQPSVRKKEITKGEPKRSISAKR